MKIVSDEVRSSSKLAYFQSNSTCQLWRGKLELITRAAPLPLGLNSSFEGLGPYPQGQVR